MAGRYRTRFFKIHTLLGQLRGDPDDLKTLSKVQHLLLHELMLVEQQIRRNKKKARKLRAARSRKQVLKLGYHEARVPLLQQRAYVWRCFGDALAYLYIDKFTLKQVYFNTENTNPRPSAGFISGKAGLQQEIALLIAALDHNVPAILSDLTNTVRFGDVCVMSGGEPRLLEVKTSKKADRRGRRQRRAIEKIHNFLETDESSELRGLGTIRRVAAEAPDKEYSATLNECLTEATQKGRSVVSPERGLAYAALTARRAVVSEVMDAIDMKSPWIVMLNDAKSQGAWQPYLPFTTTISNTQHLWRFVRGSLIILVLVDLNVLGEIVQDHGFEVTSVEPDEGHLLEISGPGKDGMMKISTQFMARAAYEFTSLEWLIEAATGRLRDSIAIGDPQNDRPT